MRKGRRGFSLVEVVCAMTVVTIISAVTIGLISSSNRVMSNSKLAVGAANEARNIIDCYTAAVIQARMVYIDDNNITETVEDINKRLDGVVENYFEERNPGSVGIDFVGSCDGCCRNYIRHDHTS